MSEIDFRKRWRLSVYNLKAAVEALQATANDLPYEAALEQECSREVDVGQLVHRHVVAFNDYTVALLCVRSLIWEYDIDGVRSVNS